MTLLVIVTIIKAVMMKEIKGSETEKNLLIAFASESQARNRYDIFAKKAKKEGYVKIFEIFSRISEQERAHASRLFKFFSGEEVKITATFPASAIGSTLENLKSAVGDEKYEWLSLYPSYAVKAREEGYVAPAVVFDSLANAEKNHQEIFVKLVYELEEGRFFKKDREVVWHCIKCGYTHVGTEAPKACPACAHSQAYFEVLGEN